MIAVRWMTEKTWDILEENVWGNDVKIAAAA